MVQLAQRSNAMERSKIFYKHVMLAAVLWLAVMASGLSVVYSTYKSRVLLDQLENLRRETNQLHVEWGQYLLEYNTWAEFGRVESEAHNQLSMKVPNNGNIVVVEQ